MTYPPRYNVGTNFPREEQLTDAISTSAMQAEYSRIAESISAIITLLRRITTTDGRLQLDQAVRISDVVTEVDLGTGDGVTTVFAFPAEIDAAVDLVRTFVDDVRVDPASYDDTEVTFAVAPAGGTAITGLIYTNLGGVLDRLQSVVADEGASMIGIADAAGLFTANNVEDALAELAGDLDSLLTALGDLGGYVLRDGTRTLTGQWEVNERSSVTIPPAAAVGAFRVNVNPSDGHYVEIDDGVTTVRFEFDNNASVGAGSVLVAIGATAADSAEAITDSINGSPLAVKAEVSGQNVTLTHEIPYALGNEPLVTSGASITAVVGMSGGVDGSFSAAYKTHYRVRNHPRSLRDGDAVVHEQLQDITGQIVAALTAFLRTDGANQMTGPLNVGGNRVINVDPATQPTDAVNLDQAEDLISDAGDTKLSLIGTKDTVAEGTLTGPVTYNRTAIETADADQTTTPSTVVIPTLHGVPRPGADDHVSNKKYVDERVASVVTGDPFTLPDFNLEGDGLGGGGLVNINNGGDFYFEDLVIAAAQTPAVPTRLFVEGNFDLQNTGSITAEGPLEIICTGNVIIAGTITCPFLSIRCGGTCTITAAITTETLGTYHYRYDQHVDPKFGGPVDPVGDVELEWLNSGGSKALVWRAVLIDSAGAVAISAAITSDDIFIKTLSNATISSTFRARWWMKTLVTGAPTPNSDDLSAEYPVGSGEYRVIAWRDTVRQYIPETDLTSDGVGGTGGTGGGNGGTSGASSVPAGASIWAAAQRPYLFYTYELARGGCGGHPVDLNRPTGNNCKGGGRISIYADGNLILSAALFDVNGSDGQNLAGNDAGGGGAGSCRLICKGTMTDGAITANGGATNLTGNAGAGGGGLAAMVAPVYAGTQSRAVTPGTGGTTPATAGLSVAATLTADQIESLADRGLFEVFPDA